MLTSVSRVSFNSFIWASKLSAGRQISSVFVSVKLYSRGGLSLAFVSDSKDQSISQYFIGSNFVELTSHRCHHVRRRQYDFGLHETFIW